MKDRYIWLIMLAVFVAMVILGLLTTGFTQTANVVVQKPQLKPICSKTLMSESCLLCHTKPDFRLMEINPKNYLRHPEWIVKSKEHTEGYYLMTNVSGNEVKKFLDYMKLHNISDITIEIQSYGGGLADVWRVIGLLQAWEKAGNIVTTKVNGIAFSAGFLVLVSGTKGHRFVSPTAELMWHELQAWPETGIQTPSSTEDRADVYRHLQDTATNWIISRSKITKEQLNEKVRNKEFWVNGAQAVKFGFADGFIGE